MADFMPLIVLNCFSCKLERITPTPQNKKKKKKRKKFLLNTNSLYVLFMNLFYLSKNIYIHECNLIYMFSRIYILLLFYHIILFVVDADYV